MKISKFPIPLHSNAPPDKQLASIFAGFSHKEDYIASLESDFSKLVGVPYGILTTSEISALMLSLSALFSEKLQSKRLQCGDEIIVSATIDIQSINVLLGFGLVPVVVDINIGNYNPAPYYIDRAITEKTRAIYISHFFGNPCDIEEIMEIAHIRNLWTIENCHGALGAETDNRHIGSFGSIAISTLSRFGNISTQEGGIILTKNAILHQIITTYPVSPNRFGYSIFDFLPTRYQAIIGKSQLRVWEESKTDRLENWNYLRDNIKNAELDNYFILPTQLMSASPIWAGFLLTLRETCPHTREDLITYLNEMGIESQPISPFPFDSPEYTDTCLWKIEADLQKLPHVEIMRTRTLWIGCHPQMTKSQLDLVITSLISFITEKPNG